MNFSKRRDFCFIIFLFIVSFNVVSSCKKDATSWQSQFSIPIAHAVLGIENIIPDSLIQTDSENGLEFIFQYPLLRVTADSLMNFPDTISQYQFTTFGNGTLTPGQTIITQNETTFFDLADAQITFFHIRNGRLRLYAVNPLTEKLKLVYSIPKATRNGQAFEFTEIIPASNGITPYIHTTYIDISGYQLDLRGQNLNQFNRLQTISTLKVDENGNTTNVAAGQQFFFYTSFDLLQLEYAKGYLGSSNTVNGPDTSDIDVFNKFTGGGISVETAEVWVDIYNGIGADIRFKLNRLFSINNRTSHTSELSGGNVFNTQNITRARSTGDYLNPFIPTTKRINFSQTNIKDLIENLPDQLAYTYQLETNPWGNISGGNDFIYNSSKLEALLNIRIPLKVNPNNLTFNDTLSYSINTKNKNVENGIIHIYVKNHYPLDFRLKIAILNNLNTETDVLVNTNRLIPAATPTLNGSIPTSSVFDVNLPKQTISRLLSSTKMSFTAISHSPNQNIVRLYQHQKLEINISGDFNINIEL